MIESYHTTLANGLRVVVHPDRNTAMVCVDIMYNVGARDERPERTGMAHLFEHLMFGGSANVPEFDRAVEKAGGLNNAWTSNDFTNFYTIVPAQNVETAFWVESDRMLAPKLTGRVLEVQRDVVVEEFKQTCLNRPYGDMMHHLRALAYTSHPYRYPTLGLTPDHVAATTDDDVRRFFDAHYSPSNAVLSISGNIEPDRAFALAEKWFGSIPARPVAPRAYAPEPVQIEARRKRVEGNVPHTTLTLAFHMDGKDGSGYIPADILSDILANGQASRLMRDVVMAGDVISYADASIIGSNEPGLLLINAFLRSNDDAAIARAEALLWEQLNKLKDSEVGPDELRRVTARFASMIAFGQMSFTAMAEELAMAEIEGTDVDARVDRYRAVTPQRLREVAGEIFRPENSSTLIYAPANA